MNEFEAVKQLDREFWFQETCRWYQDGIVEADDGKTYRGRDVLDRVINLLWLRGRMAYFKVENLNPHWVLSIIEDKFPKRENPLPLNYPTLKALIENQRTSAKTDEVQGA